MMLVDLNLYKANYSTLTLIISTNHNKVGAMLIASAVRINIKAFTVYAIHNPKSPIYTILRIILYINYIQYITHLI